MSENIDVNRFAIVAILVAANAKHPAKYPDFEMLNAMSDSDLVAFADGLLFSLEHSSSPKDEVEAEVIDGLRGVIRGDEQQVELHVQRAALEGKCFDSLPHGVPVRRPVEHRPRFNERIRRQFRERRLRT